MQCEYVGKPIPKLDAVQKVTASSRYIDDIRLPGMLYGKILRSQIPHGRVKLDISRAEKLPGVMAVVTGKDAPVTRWGALLYDQPLLARDKIRYIGEAIAAVAAKDLVTAEAALEMIEVEYEELPAICDPLEALDPKAVIIHEELETYDSVMPLIRYGNVCSFATNTLGDTERVFETADIILEKEFGTQFVHQSYLETRGSIASFDSLGCLTVWTSCQGIWSVAYELSQALDLPMSKIRIVNSEVGGGFGGKQSLASEPYAALLALKSKQPVKIILTREEELMGGGGAGRHAAIINLKIGAKKDGTFLALQNKQIFDTGAYANRGPGIHQYAAIMMCGPYRFEAVHVDTFCVYTNNPTAGSFRGYGNPQISFAREQIIDMLASELNLDPVQIRLRNILKSNEPRWNGFVFKSIGIKDCIDQVVEHARNKVLPSPSQGNLRYGRGIACMEHSAGYRGSSAVVRVLEDGTVSILTGFLDMGQGSRTALTMMAADSFGISIDDIRLVMGDTDSSSPEYDSSASRSVYNGGVVIVQAIEDAKRQLFSLASDVLGLESGDLVLRNGMVCSKEVGERVITLKELARLSYHKRGGPIIGRASIFPGSERMTDPAKLPQNESLCLAFPARIYAAQLADVEVDIKTGQVRVLRVIAAHDVGRAIHPSSVEGQIEGGVAMGIGYSLIEEVLLERGRVLNPTFLDYHLPTSMDVPDVEPIIVEDLEPSHPFGAKGVGEPGMVPTAAAIANAVYDAVGVWISDLPITPEKVLSAIKQSGEYI